MAKNRIEKLKSRAVSNIKSAKVHLRNDYDGANIRDTALCGRTRGLRTMIRFKTLAEFDELAARDEMLVCGSCLNNKNR